MINPVFHYPDDEQFQAARAASDIPTLGYSEGQVYYDRPVDELVLSDETVGGMMTKPGFDVAIIIASGPGTGTYTGPSEMLKAVALLTDNCPDPVFKLTITGLIDGVPGTMIYKQTETCPHMGHTHWKRVD